MYQLTLKSAPAAKKTSSPDDIPGLEDELRSLKAKVGEMAGEHQTLERRLAEIEDAQATLTRRAWNVWEQLWDIAQSEHDASVAAVEQDEDAEVPPLKEPPDDLSPDNW